MYQQEISFLSSFIEKKMSTIDIELHDSRRFIIFLDPQTELAVFKYEYYVEGNIIEIYGDNSKSLFQVVTNMLFSFQQSNNYSFLDADAIDKLKKYFFNYLKTKYPNYTGDFDYCYVIIEDEVKKNTVKLYERTNI